MTQPTGKEVLLATVTKRGDAFYIAVTDEHESGIELGPFVDSSHHQIHKYVTRIQRHILVNWFSWYTILQAGDVMLYDEAVRKLTLDCMIRTGSQEEHDRWMKNHPLPAPTVVPLNEQGVSESFQKKMDSLIWPEKRDE